MNSLPPGIAYLLPHEVTGAINKNDADASSGQPAQAMYNRATALHSQRERNKIYLIGNIKQAVADMVLATGKEARMKNSDYLSRKLNHDYTYLANLFSVATGSSIEEYIIRFRIEQVKELLIMDELNLTQISYRLSYSSVAYLSSQFKKVTGMTPSLFRIYHREHGKVQESGNDINVFCNHINTLEVRRVSFAT